MDNSETTTEMTLAKWCASLPECHLVNKELKQLKSELDNFKSFPQLCPACQKSYRGGECLGCRVTKLQTELNQLSVESLDIQQATERALTEQIDEIQDELDKYRWIPVSEELPEERKEIEFCVVQNKNSRFIDLGHYTIKPDGLHNFFGKQGQYATTVISHYRYVILPEQAGQEGKVV